MCKNRILGLFKEYLMVFADILNYDNHGTFLTAFLYLIAIATKNAFLHYALNLKVQQ